MLHVMSLSVDETAEVQDYTAGFVTLARKRRIRVLKSRELLHVAFALSLKLFRNVLLKDKRFESIITLLLCAVETLGKACSVILLLLDERCETAVFTFVILNLDFELLRLFGKLFGESLEFEELPTLLMHVHESV